MCYGLKILSPAAMKLKRMPSGRGFGSHFNNEKRSEQGLSTVKEYNFNANISKGTAFQLLVLGNNDSGKLGH